MERNDNDHPTNMFSKVFFALATATLALAAPSARQLEGAATCTYELTPSTPFTSTDPNTVAAEFNYTLGHSIGSAYPNKGIDGTPEQDVVANSDGSYTVTDTFAVEGVTEAELKATVLAWLGSQLTGFSIENWTVDGVTCE